MPKPIIMRIMGDASGFERALDKTQGRLKKFGGLAKTALAGAGAAAGAALVTGVTNQMSNEMDADRIAASMGLDGKSQARLSSIVTDVFTKGWGDSKAEVNAAVATIQRRMGELDDGEVGILSERALAFSEIFQTDVQGSINAASILLKNGLAKDGEQAFDILTSSLQKVAPSVRGEVLDATEEYSTFFSDLGLSGEQAFGMIVRAAEKGGNFGVDKVGDALKELSTRATDMSKTTVQAYEWAGLNADEMAQRFAAGGDTARGALDDLVKGLQGIEDPVYRSNAAIALFGAPLEDLSGSEIPSFLSQLTNLEGGLGDVEGSTKRAGDTLNSNFGKTLDSVKRTAMSGFMSAISGVMDTLRELEPHVVRAGQIIQDVFEKARPFIERIRTAVEGFVLDAIAFFERLWDRVQQHWPAIEKQITKVVTTVQGHIETFIDFVSWLWEAWGDDLLRLAKTYFDYIKRTIKNAVDIVAGTIQTVLALITGDWDSAWKGIRKVLSAVWDQIKNIVTTSINAVKSILGGVVSTIQALWRVAWDKIKSYLSDRWEDIKSDVSGGIETIRTWFGELPGKIVGAIKYGLQALLDVGEWIIQKILNGVIALAEATNGIKGWFGGLPGRIVNWVLEKAQDLIQGGKDIIGKIVEGVVAAAPSLKDAVLGAIPGGSVIGGAVDAVIGDGPGAPPGGVTGGSALSRVQSALIPGTYVTSTYRSPAKNAAVGGSPTSYHMDRNNPAVDIGGSTAALDRLARKLRGMGGWREFLWRTAGHYDHIHVAHSGGHVTRNGIEPLRRDELLTKLQVGETVLPKGYGSGDTIKIEQNFFGFSTDEARRLAREGTEEALRSARQRKRKR